MPKPTPRKLPASCQELLFHHADSRKRATYADRLRNLGEHVARRTPDDLLPANIDQRALPLNSPIAWCHLHLTQNYFAAASGTSDDVLFHA